MDYKFFQPPAEEPKTAIQRIASYEAEHYRLRQELGVAEMMRDPNRILELYLMIADIERSLAALNG